ncbi:MAG: thioredoxin domain-containing protein [Acidobacteriota bacterium]
MPLYQEMGYVPHVNSIRRVVTLLAAGSLIACSGAHPAAATPEEKVQTYLDRIPKALPGAQPLGEDLRLQLAKRLAAAGSTYVPRTRHLHEDGSPLYSNRLFLESSPYLRQHSHNPVNWYPWGDEAFETARRLKRPVLLSIGYSTCHWCHVMEEESFEDVEIATVINQLYIPIKVDREVRPDVDAIYMRAVQTMNGGHGGWPLNAWLTPDREPFYGGTYFPARDGDRGARQGFLTLLKGISEIYQSQPEKILKATSRITQAVRQGLEQQSGDGGADSMPGVAVLNRAQSFFASHFDAVEGGVGRAPKFPSSLPVRFLLRYHRRTGDARALEMATLTLTKMARGGICDQVGGGFHRYSTDQRWLVPHFEKMLYENALLAMAYLEGWQATGRDLFARTAREILSYVQRDMTAPEGGFYSATDADSRIPGGEMEEGWFFTWTPAEISAVLDAKDARLVSRYYGVTPAGNFEGRNILHVQRPLEEVAPELGLNPAKAREKLQRIREVLYQARQKRPQPLRDDKILAAWNGLMISAFAQGGRILGEPSFTRSAVRAADFILTHMQPGGRLRRSFREGRAENPAFLEDHAFLIAGLLDLYEAQPDPRWIRAAKGLQANLDQRYSDKARGGYFTTAADQEKLLAREKPNSDGAVPSGNSIAALALLQLAELTTDDHYRVEADRILAGFGDVLNRAPAALSEMLLALDFRLDRPKEIVLVRPAEGGDPAPLLDRLRRTFLPNRVLVDVTEGADLARLAELVPLVEGKVARGGKVTAYVCEKGVCKLPTTDPEQFARQIEEVWEIKPEVAAPFPWN